MHTTISIRIGIHVRVYYFFCCFGRTYLRIQRWLLKLNWGSRFRCLI